LQSNIVDARRCPRCYAPNHGYVVDCPLGETASSPPLVRTSRTDDFRSAAGAALTTHRIPWCNKCHLWGHLAAVCPRCTICNRWGHGARDCASGLPPSRFVPNGPEPLGR
jgi:hypothetical protein